MAPPKPIPDASSALIERLAERVRAARLVLGLPRRELAVRSGVSPRYLAQLEAGEGNISVLLLHRVAMALNVTIEDLFAERPSMDADAARVAQLFCAAPSTVQGRVRALLAPQSTKKMRAQRVCLVGLKHSGKTTLGKLAAEKLHVPFVELDDDIADLAGMPLSEVERHYGHDGYRAFEERALANVIERYDQMVLAVSGEIVAQSASYERILERFHTIWVRVNPSVHLLRAQVDRHQMGCKPVAIEHLKTHLADQTPQYERALTQVDTSNMPIATSVNEVLAIIAKGRFMQRVGVE